MKRVAVFMAVVAIAGAAFVGFWQTGAEAGTAAFHQRFEGAAKMGDSGAYSFDKSHTAIGFRVKHMGLVDVPGYFRDFVGTVNFDAKDVTKSTVEFTAKATSVDTGVKGRDDHLRRDDFFGVEKFPDITFKSTKVAKKGNGYMLTGDFTMRGVTKSITFPFEISGWLPPVDRDDGKMGLTAETTINRRDYGVNYGTNLPSGIPALSDDVKIVLLIEAVKKKDAPKAE